MSDTTVPPEYLTTDEVAARYRTVSATVRYWRMVAYGPRGVRCGRRILYPLAEVRRFDAELAELAGGPGAQAG